MRYLEVKNYKNIGVQNEQEKDERLYLNNSFNGDKLGGLVIILGENNTGKSNLLKALGCFSEHVNEFKKNCTPNYLGFKDAITKLGLCAEEKSGKYQNNVFKANIEIKNDEVSYSLTPTTEQLKSVCFALLNSLGGLEANTKTDFINKLNRTNNEDSLLKLFNEIDQLLSNEKVVIKVKKQFQKDLSDCKTKLKQELEQITNKWNGYLRLDITKIGEIIDNIVNKETTLEYMQSYLEQFRELVKGCVDRYNRNNWNHINYPNFPTIDLEEPILKNPTLGSHVDYENMESVLKDYPLEKYADVKHFLHSKLGQVFYYKPTKSFEAEDLMTTPDDLTQSEFFELLFNAIDQNAFKEIKEAYNAYTEKNREVI
nr:ATP-binding protein [Helicobacter pylori]